MNQAGAAQEPTKSNRVTTKKQHALKLVKNMTKSPFKLLRTPPSNNSAQLKRTSDCSAQSTRTEATQIEKSVAFATRDTVHHTIARQDFSSEELEAAFFSEEEYFQISKRCHKQIDRMDHGETLKDRKYCARGLEAHTGIGSITKSKSRAQSIRAVLQEQDVQIRQGVLDEEAIGVMYHDVTSSCQMWASVIGLRDQHAAEGYMDGEETQVLPQAGVDTREPCTRIELSSATSAPRRRKSTIISARSA
jgi:hypothetical protein